MASKRKSYDGVKKLQKYLEENTMILGLPSGKDTLLSKSDEGFTFYDGKYGNDTDTVYQGWVGGGGSLDQLVGAGVLSSEDVLAIGQAQREHEAIKADEAKGTGNGGTPKEPPVIPGAGTTGGGNGNGEGWSTMTWVLIGAAVAGAGILGWRWMKGRQAKKLPARSRAAAGLDDTGCGCGG